MWQCIHLWICKTLYETLNIYIYIFQIKIINFHLKPSIAKLGICICIHIQFFLKKKFIYNFFIFGSLGSYIFYFKWSLLLYTMHLILYSHSIWPLWLFEIMIVETINKKEIYFKLLIKMPFWKSTFSEWLFFIFSYGSLFFSTNAS